MKVQQKQQQQQKQQHLKLPSNFYASCGTHVDAIRSRNATAHCKSCAATSAAKLTCSCREGERQRRKRVGGGRKRDRERETQRDRERIIAARTEEAALA